MNPNYTLSFDENSLKIKISNFALRRLDNETVIFGLNALTCLTPYYNMTTSSMNITLIEENFIFESKNSGLNFSFEPDEIYSKLENSSTKFSFYPMDHFYTIFFPRIFIENFAKQFIVVMSINQIVKMEYDWVQSEFIDMDVNEVLVFDKVVKNVGEHRFSFFFNFTSNIQNFPANPLAPIIVLKNFKMRVVLRKVF
jgi:hypothetical protein